MSWDGFKDAPFPKNRHGLKDLDYGTHMLIAEEREACRREADAVMTHSEIAQVLSSTRQAVYMMEKRALRKLRESGALDAWRDHVLAEREPPDPTLRWYSDVDDGGAGDD